MALKLNERYPGRFDNPTTAYPQGAFKNRSAPGAQDGSYLEKDWANDVLGFLSHLLVSAGLTPNGTVDTALSSQYYDALSTLINNENKYGAPMIGELVMWPRPQMPQEMWPDMKMEFIPYMGQTFDTARYPLLAHLHPTGVLSADMRGMFPRGWDNTRGIDPGRGIMMEQDDAIRNITGTFNSMAGSGILRAIGTVSGAFKKSTPSVSGAFQGSSSSGSTDPEFDASLVVPTAAENRPKNVAWNMIVRAK